MSLKEKSKFDPETMTFLDTSYLVLVPIVQLVLGQQIPQSDDRALSYLQMLVQGRLDLLKQESHQEMVLVELFRQTELVEQRT